MDDKQYLESRIMDNEEKTLEQRQPDISLKQANAPTFIGDNTHVYSININQYNQRRPQAICEQPSYGEFVLPTLNLVEDEDQRAIDDQASNDKYVPPTFNQVQDDLPQRAILDEPSNYGEYTQPTPNQVQKQIAQIEERIQQNNQEATVKRDSQKYFENIKVAQENQYGSSVQTELHEKEAEEKSLFYEVDEEIKKLPYTSIPLLEDLINTISQTQDIPTREGSIKRINHVLERISASDCFQKNTCGIYQAEVTLRELLLVSDHEKVLQCISIYCVILSVIIKNGQLLQDLKCKDSLKPFLRNLRKRLDSPQILLYSRIRRDVKAVIKMLSEFFCNPRMLQKSVQFLYKVQIIGDTSIKKVIKLCKQQLKTRSWFQHFLIISWLTLEVLTGEKTTLLKVLLQVVSYYGSKFCQQRESYQWKFTLTVVENLTKIAKIIPDLSEIAIAGSAAEGLPGLVDFFQILKNQKCKKIFIQNAQSLTYIENVELRNLLLTGIFSEVDVSQSEEIMKEVVENSQSFQNMAIIKTLYNGKNTWNMLGHFENSQVVAKIYKLKSEELTSKRFQVTKNARFANELFMLSNLRRKPHPNIVKLITCDEELLCLVLNYVSKGCLLQSLRRCRNEGRAPKVTDLLNMIVQITEALVFLEEEQIIHLGIMAENVLLSENFHVFLTGFQSSCKRKGAANKMTIEDEHVKWMDQEILHGQPASHATDVWSLGVMVYEMFTYGCVPYNNPTNNFDQGDFERKPMTASQTRGFIHRWGMLPKQPCIPEQLFQIISTKCFVPRAIRASATELRDVLIELKEEMEDLSNIPLPPPPQLCFFRDVDSWEYDRKYKGAIYHVEEQNEVPLFTYLDELETDWNEGYNMHSTTLDDVIYDKKTYTDAGRTNNKPVLCRYREHEDCQTKLVVLEFKEFRDITLAKKLRDLNYHSLVRVLGINSFAPKNLEMISESFPLGNVLSALLSDRTLRQHVLLYMIQAASAVIYLHENGILHRHLKAEHILLEQRKQIKVGRLGFAKEEEKLSATYVDEHILNHRDFVNARWNPPEVVKNGSFSKESDYWSFGIVCWELSQALISPPGTKKKDILPYNKLKDDEVFRKIERGDRLTDPSSSTLYNIYKEFWKYEPNERMSIFSGRDKLHRLSHLSSSSNSTLNEDEYGVQERRDVRKKEISNAANLFRVESSGREIERNNKDYCKGEMSHILSNYEQVENPYDTCYDDESYLKDQYEMERKIVQDEISNDGYYENSSNWDKEAQEYFKANKNYRMHNDQEHEHMSCFRGGQERNVQSEGVNHNFSEKPGAVQSTNITNEYYDDVANILVNDLENNEINENDGTE